MITKIGISKVLTGFVLLLMLATTAFAQQTTSSIRGKVIGTDGQPVASARVVIEDNRTGTQRSLTSNESGVFLATKLSVGGPYTVTVSGAQPVVVPSIALGEIYSVSISLQSAVMVEEVLVTGTVAAVADVAAGPAATFSSFDLETTVAFNRDIVDVYSVDPRLNIDNEDDGFAVNCAGKHPRFNSVTLDGVSHNDRFGLNENGYSTAVGMPFPYDAIAQVSVELAPFDVTYGGFSACNINAVTKSGSNEWDGNVFFEWTDDDLKGDKTGDSTISATPYIERKRGFSVGGPIMKDKLFVYAAWEETEEPRTLAIGYAGSGNGVERPWMSEADFNQVTAIAQSVYGYDPGGQPADGAQEDEKYMIRLDWNVTDQHSAAAIYNYYDGFQDRNSDGDDDEFEYANHFYQKGAESTTYTLKFSSQWTDAFSTEFFYSNNEMIDSQVTVGPKDFAEMQISTPGGETIYLGADDSRQANRLNTESDFLKITGTLLWRDHVFTAGYESEELTIFNQFVQHARGGEIRFFDSSSGNHAGCAALTPQQRFDGMLPAGGVAGMDECGASGMDLFQLGRPSRYYYGSGGGSNDAADAAALFSNTLNSLYLQDEIFIDDKNLTIVAGLRYDFFDSSDRPTFNQAFTDANGGLRNDANIDGIDLIMPRLGFTWEARDDLSVRGGLGLYSGGNPNVWLSNAWSNDGFTNVQLQNRYNGSVTLLPGMPDSLALVGAGRPGYDVPQEMFDEVAGTTAADASTSRLVIIDPNYEQPSEWKFALGATYDLPWWGVVADVDYLHTSQKDPAFYVDLSQEIVGTTMTGQPIYDYTNGQDNFMLTNSSSDGEADVFSIALRKDFDFGLDLMLGYAYTDATDVSPMTSSTAGSNFDNTALLDVNRPTAATSNYVVPHRLTFRGSYGNEFFSGLETRVTLLGYASEGQPQTFVMGGTDLEGDGFFGRHLLYIPTGPSDPNVDLSGLGSDESEFFAWAAREGLGAGFVGRNSKHAKWSTRFDLRVDQEIPTFIKGTKGRAFFKLYNVGNFLNDDWGKVNDAFFFSQQVVNASVNASGQYVYSNFRDRSVNNHVETRSLWEGRLGVSFSF